MPSDPAQFVIHRSDRHMMGLYGTSGYDRDGVRDRIEDQSPRPGIQRKDPISPELDARVDRRNGSAAPTVAAEAPNPWDQTDIGRRLNRMFGAAGRDDWGEVMRAADEHARSPEFREWDRWGQESLGAQELQHQQQQEMQAQQSRGRSL